MQKRKKKRAFQKGVPRLSHSMNEGLRKIGLADDPAIKSFFGGTLADYIRTPRGKADIERVISSREEFEHYMQALQIEGAIDLMIDFLKTKEGVESFVSVCEKKEGLRLMIKIGQTDEGREVGFRMVKSPPCWLPVLRIIRGIRNLYPAKEDTEEPGPRFDLSPFRDSGNGVKQLIPILRDPEKTGDVFVSLSQSKEDVRFCRKVLEDDEARKSIFDYITGNRDKVMETFRMLLGSKKRRGRISGLFACKGGINLLKELAQDATGKEMLTELLITANGISVGARAALKGSWKKPTMVIEIGKAYFQKPKTGAHVLEVILSAVFRFFGSIFP